MIFYAVIIFEVVSAVVGGFFASLKLSNVTLANVMIILFALPSYYFFIRSVGVKRGLIIITILNVFALVVETVAITTGLPYGNFTYSNELGFKLLGVTPWTVGISWSMIVLGVAALNRQLAVMLLTMLFTDLLLDPGAVALGYWRYANNNGFYNVPFSNFAGWLITGSIGLLIFTFLTKNKKLKIETSLSFLSLLLFWTVVAIKLGLLLPALIGLLLIIYTVREWVLAYNSGSESSKV